MKKLRAAFKTFGCKVNTYDTGLIEKKISAEGFDITSLDKDLDVVVFNSCAVTGEATKDLVKEIKKIKKISPHTKVVVTGCSAQVDGNFIDDLSEVDLIVANSHKGEIAKIMNQKFVLQIDNTKIFRSNIFRKEDMGLGGGQKSERTRSFLKIQDGCNSFCSFCIIPYARGKSQSLSVDYLLHKIEDLVDAGIKEVVLSGIHIGDYYDDESLGGPYRLEDLIESVLKGTKISRIRLGSLEPVELTSRLLELYQDERMCPHFHMSIQSANDNILKLMKRKYGQKEVVESLNNIAKKIKNPFVGMDVIAGFPSETENEFLDTYKVLESTPWTRLHVFPYSERQGTRATFLQNAVPWSERKRRAKILNVLSSERFSKAAISQLNTEKRVLVLKTNKGQRGIASDFWSIDLSSEKELSLGIEVNVKIKGYHRTNLSLSPILLEGEVI